MLSRTESTMGALHEKLPSLHSMLTQMQSVWCILLPIPTSNTAKANAVNIELCVLDRIETTDQYLALTQYCMFNHTAFKYWCV